MPKKQSTSKKKGGPTIPQLRAEIKVLENELWELRQAGGAEFATQGLKMADISEWIWRFRSMVASRQGNDDDAVQFGKLAQKESVQRAQMLDRVEQDMVPKIVKELEERKRAGARLQAIPKRQVH